MFDFFLFSTDFEKSETFYQTDINFKINTTIRYK